MTIYLKQSTSSQEVLLGPFVDSTDGVTAETALSIANTDIKIWVAGATTLANKNSGGATHISAGNYYAVLDATDTATLGSGRIVVQVTGALAVFCDFVVLATNIYDALIGGGDLLDVSVTQWLGTAPAAPAVAGVVKVDVTHFNGTAATSAAGIPAVNSTQFAGQTITAAAGVTLPASVASPTNITAGTITTTTNLTNLPAITANWLTATGIAADAITAAKVHDDVSTEIRDKIIQRTTVRGAATTGTLSTTQCTTTGMSPAMTVSGQLIGRILIWDHNTSTPALQGQATDITASTAAANPLLTFTALTTAPSNGDTFTIV